MVQRLVPTDGEPSSLIENNQSYLSDMIEGVVVPPSIDYLAISVWSMKEDRAAIRDYLDTSGELNFREFAPGWTLVGQSIRAHGREVARVVPGGGTSHFGRKLLFHFPGVWFRKPPAQGEPMGERHGLGLDTAAAWRLIQVFREHMARFGPMGSNRPDWVTFHGIDRVDYVTEVKVKRGVTPRAWRHYGMTHPGQWDATDYLESKKGISQYFGPADSSLGSRHKSELVRVYQSLPSYEAYQGAEEWPTIRIEYETYRLRHVSGKPDHTPETARTRAADLWCWYAGKNHRPEDVPLVDFFTNQGPHAYPEELTSRQWVGHSGAHVRRMMRQGVTVATRSFGMVLAATQLTFANAAHEKVPEADMDSPSVTAPGVIPPVGVVLDTDPIPLDELYALESAVSDYRRLMYPGTAPYAEMRPIIGQKWTRADQVLSDEYRDDCPKGEGGPCKKILRLRKRARCAPSPARTSAPGPSCAWVSSESEPECYEYHFAPGASVKEQREALKAHQRRMIDAAFAIRMQRAKDESEVWFRGFYEKIPKWWDENNRLPPHRLALEKTHIPAHGSVEWVVGEGEPRRNDITAARDVWLDRTTGEVACDLSIPDPRHQLRTYYEQKAAEGRALALRNVMHVAFRRTKGLKRNTENGETWQDVVRAELPYHPELADLGWELLRSSAWEMYDMIMALLPTDRRQFFAVRGHVPEPVSLRELDEARKRSKF